MLARFTHLPLRRCIHTQAARSHHTTRFTRAALGASAVTAAYLAWRSLSEPIALDSPTSIEPTQKPPIVSSKPPSKVSLSSSSPTSSLSGSTPETVSLPSSERQAPSVPRKGDSIAPDSKGEDTEGVRGEEGHDDSSDGADGGGGGGGGAFNPQTGEINWDCPCLGGMAHGPCGPEFREAFSCFVFSEQEPKGIDCVEKFQAMQTCFRAHPDVYSDEIMDDDEEEEGAPVPESAPVATKSGDATPSTTDATSPSSSARHQTQP